jgi:hypothetical protein
MDINPYNSGGAKLEVVGSTATSMNCGAALPQTVATLRYNDAFLTISDANNCERITRTSPSLGLDDCCTTTTVVGTWSTYDDVINKINYAILNGPGSGTVGDPYIVAA